MTPACINGNLLYKNLIAIKSISDLARLFPSIRFILIKGGALATIDADMFLRSMEDVDVVLGDEDSYDVLIRHIEKNPDWRKIPNDPNSFARCASPTNASSFLTIVDFHKNFWYAPSVALNAAIINRSVKIEDEDGISYPPNLMRLSPEDLWIDTAVHAVFHHTLRVADRVSDLKFIESVFPIDGEVVAKRLTSYFGEDMSGAILEVFGKKLKNPRRKIYFLSALKNYSCRKFLEADFPAKGFVARIFLVRRGFADSIKYIVRDMIFPPAEFLSRRYGAGKSSLKSMVLYRILRPLFLAGKLLSALAVLIVQHISVFKGRDKNLPEHNY